MLIVLEGVDGAGKTTLTQRIMSTLPAETLRLHSGPLKGDPLKEYLWRLRAYQPDSYQNIICDRWHVGELIYGPLFRGQSKLTPEMLTYIEMFLDKLGAYKLVVTADLMTIRQRLTDRGENLLATNDVGMVWDFYNEYAHEHSWQLVGSDEVMSSITSRARALRAGARQLMPYHSYVGPTNPRFLVLGKGTSLPLAGRPAYEQAFVPYLDTPYPGIIKRMGNRIFGMADPMRDNIQMLQGALGNPTLVAVDKLTSDQLRYTPHKMIGDTI